MDAHSSRGNPAGPDHSSIGTAKVEARAHRFGRAMLEHWPLDPDVTYLNHGTVGAPPRRVLEAQQRVRDEVARRPSQFLLRELTAISAGAPLVKPRLREAADRVAEFVGARGEDLVFVDNATTGANAVLRSLELRAEDEILLIEGGYGAVHNAARYVAREHRVQVRQVPLPYPIEEPSQVTNAVAQALRPNTRLAIVDHIMSESALLLPVAEIAATCRGARVPLLVDGAHAPGAIELNISKLGVDWYTGNLHKWAHAPHTSGILWTAPDRQSSTHPVVISWGLDQGYTTEFDLVGTRDPSAHLAAPEGIAFMRDLGLDAMRAYNHELAWEAAQMLSSRFATPIGKPESMVGTMITIPLPARTGSSRDDSVRLRDALLFEDKIEVQLHAWRDRLWVRVSAQVYNELRDIERLAAAIEKRI
jgi:isopenicillin-N epimerase